MNEKFNSFIQRVERIIVMTVKKAMDPYFAGGAAEVAFYLLMSLVPTTILLAQILNLFKLSMDVVEGLITEYVNDDIAAILLRYFDNGTASTLSTSVVLIALAFWAGSKALFSLMRITNYAYLGGNPSKNPLTGYIKERARAIFTVLVILFTLVFAINIVIFGRVIVDAILTYLNGYLGGDYNVDEIWLDIRWILGFILYFFMVVSIYYLLPSSGKNYRKLIRRSKWKSIQLVIGAWLKHSKATLKTIFPGSLFASIGMMVVTWGYSIYMGSFSKDNFNILYGGLSTVVVLLLWFYLLAYVLILGIQINSIWEESKFPKGRVDKYRGDNNRGDNNRGDNNCE